jgi:hypothetical protein
MNWSPLKKPHQYWRASSLTLADHSIRIVERPGLRAKISFYVLSPDPPHPVFFGTGS